MAGSWRDGGPRSETGRLRRRVADAANPVELAATCAAPVMSGIKQRRDETGADEDEDSEDGEHHDASLLLARQR